MTFSDRVWSAVINSWGATFTLVGFSISILSFFVVPNSETIPLSWFLLSIILLVVILGIFIRATYDANFDSNIVLPTVRTIIEPPATYKDASALLLLDPSELLSQDCLVSVYFIDGGIERLAGIGVVVNIQNDKKIQVILVKDAEFSDKVEALKSNNQEDLSKIIVKPSVPSFYLGGE
jgi:hypothetical protein